LSGAQHEENTTKEVGQRRKPLLRVLAGVLAATRRRKRFDLEQYLRTRKRSPLEARFHKEVQRFSHGAMTVEDVQRLCNEMHSKIEVMRVLLERLDLRGQRETDRFTYLFGKLWDHTPRVDLDGASPAEKLRDAPTASSSSRIGRNDPCPCGSGKKFKHCCG